MPGKHSSSCVCEGGTGKAGMFSKRKGMKSALRLTLPREEQLVSQLKAKKKKKFGRVVGGGGA